MNDKFTSIVRTNNVDHHRKRIGLDGVTITPMDKHGMCYVYLLVVTATKLVAGYPVAAHSALSVAQSLYSFRVTYCHYDDLATDPGSDIMSDGVAMYLQCTGKLIIGKLSEFIGMIPINSDKFIGSDKIIGWWFAV